MANRIVPKAGPEHYKSYSWRRPLGMDGFWRRVTCEEYRCKAFRRGWQTVVDISTELGQRQYHYLSHDKSRKWAMEKTGDCLVTFSYPPGQEFFDGSPAHRHVRPANIRPPLLLVSGGDWRGNPRQVRTVVHRSADDWLDDFSSNLDRLARARN
jgi:hypothetical protein